MLCFLACMAMAFSWAWSYNIAWATLPVFAHCVPREGSCTFLGVDELGVVVDVALEGPAVGLAADPSVERCRLSSLSWLVV